jgi:hypothetical protein
MTKLMERAIEAVQAMPPDTQDELARLLLRIAGDDEAVIELTPEEEASFAESFAQAARGEFATDEQIRAIWAKHGL